MATTPADFKAVIVDPTSSKCAGFTKALLRLPVLIYQWMTDNVDATTGKVIGSAKAGDLIMSASPIAEDDHRKLCNGQELVKTDWPVLYAAIGDIYGTAPYTAPSSGSNFRVPDMRFRFPLGVGTSAKPTAVTLGLQGGDEEVILTEGELPEVDTPLLGDGTETILQGVLTSPVGSSGSGAVGSSSGNSFRPHSDPKVKFGSGEAHPNMPPYVGCYFYVTTGK